MEYSTRNVHGLVSLRVEFVYGSDSLLGQTQSHHSVHRAHFPSHPFPFHCHLLKSDPAPDIGPHTRGFGVMHTT